MAHTQQGKPTTRSAGRAGDDGQPSSLARVFPSQEVTLDSGRKIVVPPWGAEALVVHNVPRRVATLFARLLPLQAIETRMLDAEWLLETLPTTATEFIAELWGVDEVSVPELLDQSITLKDLSARDIFRIAIAVFEVNRGFFDDFKKMRALKDLVGGVGKRPTTTTAPDGSESPPASSEPASG